MPKTVLDVCTACVDHASPNSGFHPALLLALEFEGLSFAELKECRLDYDSGLYEVRFSTDWLCPGSYDRTGHGVSKASTVKPWRLIFLALPASKYCAYMSSIYTDNNDKHGKPSICEEKHRS